MARGVCGSTRNGCDSESKRLGVKSYGGELINAGTIIMRQRGTTIHPGVNVGWARITRCSGNGHRHGAVRGQGRKEPQVREYCSAGRRRISVCRAVWNLAKSTPGCFFCCRQQPATGRGVTWSFFIVAPAGKSLP